MSESASQRSSVSKQWQDVHLLVCASDILAYEWQMLRFCNSRVNVLKGDDEHTQDHDAFLEASLIHSRALIEFFFGCVPRDNDIYLLRWFAPDSAPYIRFATDPHRCACWSAKVEMDRRLAHLTTARVGGSVYGHDPRVAKWLDELMCEFVHLAGDRVGERLKSLLEMPGNVAIFPATAQGTSGIPGLPRDQRAPG
ncbi:MAG: hypothetical protein ACYCYF_04420 [Anaerolineae bacterium]